jgi:hypothetical protein
VSPASTAVPVASFAAGTFNGSTDGASLGKGLLEQLTGDFTIEFSVKPAATQQTHADIIDFNHRATLGLVIQQNGDQQNSFQFAINDGSASAVIEYQLRPDLWQSLAFQREGTEIRLYLDGKLVATKPCFSGAISFLPDSEVTVAYNKTYGRHFHGEIKDLKIWGYARSTVSTPPSSSTSAAQETAVATGLHYSIVNHTGDMQNRHDFLIDPQGRTVRELNQPTTSGDQTLTVSVFRPGSRLVMRTLIRSSGYWIEYDWVFLEDGRILAGCYRDAGSAGPSVGYRVP